MSTIVVEKSCHTVSRPKIGRRNTNVAFDNVIGEYAQKLLCRKL